MESLSTLSNAELETRLEAVLNKLPLGSYRRFQHELEDEGADLIKRVELAQNLLSDVAAAAQPARETVPQLLLRQSADRVSPTNDPWAKVPVTDRIQVLKEELADVRSKIIDVSLKMTNDANDPSWRGFLELGSREKFLQEQLAAAESEKFWGSGR